MFKETQTYLLYYLNGTDETPFYVGEAIDPQKRYRDHLNSCYWKNEAKEAYDFIRAERIPMFYMEIVPGITEAALVRELQSQGHEILNANKGRKSNMKSVNWRRANQAIFERLQATAF